MKKVVWWLGFAVLIPWTAIADRVEAGVVGDEAKPVVRMCQSFRYRDGKPYKVGQPHPCKEPRNLRLSSNLTGGRYLPQ